MKVSSLLFSPIESDVVYVVWQLHVSGLLPRVRAHIDGLKGGVKVNQCRRLHESPGKVPITPVQFHLAHGNG